MRLPITDIRFTTRRGSSSSWLIYPKLLRGSEWLPKTDIAIQYFESMLGRERQEIDTDVLVHFFGDHKLARSMVACLGRSYRFRQQSVDDIVAGPALRRLRQATLDSPRALRLHLYDELNDRGHGFLPGSDRAAIFRRLEKSLGLAGGDFERLLLLDAPEQARLVRFGAEPRAADVVASYNFTVLYSLLRHAEWAAFDLTNWSREASAGLEGLFGVHQLDASIETAGGQPRARVLGRRDALGRWSRHGHRLARLVVQLLLRARDSVLAGEALIHLKERRCLLRLTPEILDLLAGASTLATGWTVLDGWDERAIADLGLLGGERRQGGWSIRRLPDPEAWANGVIAPDLLVRAGERQAQLCVVRSAAHGEHLVPLFRAATTGEPMVFVGAPSTTAGLREAGARVLTAAQPEPRLVVSAAQLLAHDGRRPSSRSA